MDNFLEQMGMCVGKIEKPMPSPAINIDTSINAAYTADKMNTAKSYIDITDC